MDRHTCKLCSRRFHNGRALGGHMRSHVMAASSAAAYYSPPPPLSLASTSSTEMDDDADPAPQKPPTPCVAREEGAKKAFGFPELSGGGRAARGESSVVQDGESDTESSPRFAVSRRRSKRPRRRAPPPAAASDPEHPASSVSDATPEEDVAMSLVMLSRDSWTRRSRPGPGPGPDPRWGPASSGADRSKDGGVRSFVGADDEADREHGDVARPRGRHRCGVCRKVFRSYQALGGHRASVKKGKGGCVPVPVPPSAAAPSPKARRGQTGPAVHECPFCSRVFESGQALGGHKRAHVAHGAPAPWTPARCGDSSGSIDLNVPAATDDDFELSAVYDAEFGSARQ
jgi:hypothetical protein